MSPIDYSTQKSETRVLEEHQEQGNFQDFPSRQLHPFWSHKN